MRKFTKEYAFHKDFNDVFDFIVRINQKEVINPCFDYSRWEWVYSLEKYLDKDNLDKIGIWEDEGRIVGMATYEGKLGDAYFLLDPEYNHLKEEMLLYAIDNLGTEEKMRIIIDEKDLELQKLARKHGFVPTKDQEEDSMIEITDDLNYSLPEGYKIVSLDEDYDIFKYGQVLHRGFDHGPDYEQDKKEYDSRVLQLSGPHNDLSLKVAVEAPNGDWVSYCGMWYDDRVDFCIVEPVATDPKYRKMGLGKAVVLEGVIRCGKLGAKRAFVGSNQQFYYNIGFNPYSTYNFWKKVK